MIIKKEATIKFEKKSVLRKKAGDLQEYLKTKQKKPGQDMRLTSQCL